MSAVLEQIVTPNKATRHLSIVPSVSPEIATTHATIRTTTHSLMVRSKLNVRSKGSGDVSELAALISSQGLLQNLVGYEQMIAGIRTGVIEIVAGGRRLAAIGSLIASGDLPEDYQIPYLLVDEAEAVAISLAENSGREPMHPADVYEAMMELFKRGASVDDIAISFGVDALRVKRRLKLANVSPRLFALYRNDEIDFDQMVALAVTDDHEAQEMAWDSGENSPHMRSAHNLRRLLTEQQINVQSDRVARFVGVEALEAAGGVVTRDLFSENGTGYTKDAVLLENLAHAKLTEAAKALEGEGLAWIEVCVRVDHAALAEYATARTSRRKPTEAEAAELAALDKARQQIQEDLNNEDEENEEAIDALYQRDDALEENEQAIRNSLVEPVEADKSLVGALVTVNHDGGMIVHRNLIRPSDKSKMVRITAASNDEDVKPKEKPIHSDRLTRILTSHRTAALQAEMMDRPDVALVVLTHGLIKKVFFTHDFSDKIAQISLQQPMLADEVKSGRAWEVLEAKREELEARLPEDSDDQTLLGWLLEQPQQTILDYMAFCTARSLNAVQDREKDSPAFVEMAKAVNLNMCDWWKPTATDYFSLVSKGRMSEVVTQAVSADAAAPLEKLKKAEAAEAAERNIALTSWLPEVLRAA